ncbi:hypothetical protein [Bacillus sp. FJAT-44742]|uniref:hypothetical protein n=1 Tax=Bacillus sp. FJAT-44742 TaxID=2014005 RepID=UPI000C2485A9|nr:hypothetical protein [Bacillus sp. FJAT-44742]
MKKWIADVKARKVEYSIVLLILIISAAVGAYFTTIIAARDNFVGFYMGFVSSTIVLFAVYSLVDKLLHMFKGKEREA